MKKVYTDTFRLLKFPRHKTYGDTKKEGSPLKSPKNGRKTHGLKAVRYWNSTIAIKRKKTKKELLGKLTQKKLNTLRKYWKAHEDRRSLVRELDKVFSEYIKNKAKGICVKCGLPKKRAGVSHYFGRRYMGTRWSEDNCDWACWGCHSLQMEHYKQPGEWYYNYMMKKLSPIGFQKLEMQAHTITKFSLNDLEMLIKVFGLGTIRK